MPTDVHKPQFNVAAPFYRQSRIRPDALALAVGEARLSYGELASLASGISRQLTSSTASPRKIGILASRSIEAYAGVLGALWSGAAYVPINPKTPEERLLRILEITRLDALIVDAAGAKCLSARVLEHAPRLILAGSIPPGLFETAEGAGITAADFLVSSETPEEPAPVGEEALAYIIFTSGTSGAPKGVMVGSGSVAHLLNAMQTRYECGPEDRVSLAFDLTFDPSVLDMFMAWGSGASLHVVPDSQLMAPAKFIRDRRLTRWNSVPSIVAFMQRMGMLAPATFPQLRFSLFGGEPLPLASAQAWQAAAPNSIVENLYGPTEATVACTVQRVTDPPNVTPSRGIIAIGTPFGDTRAAVVDSSLNPVPQGTPGELMLAGRQLALGYCGDPELTAARFPMIRGRRWYRTGDLVYQETAGILHHLGRIDNQVKILGNRVEL